MSPVRGVSIGMGFFSHEITGRVGYYSNQK